MGGWYDDVLDELEYQKEYLIEKVVVGKFLIHELENYMVTEVNRRIKAELGDDARADLEVVMVGDELMVRDAKGGMGKAGAYGKRVAEIIDQVGLEAEQMVKDAGWD